MNLNNLVPYVSKVEGNTLLVEVGNDVGSGSTGTSNAGGYTAPSQADYGSNATSETSYTMPSSQGSTRGSAITNIDFRRGELGEGKVIINITDPSIKIDVEEKANGIEIKFLDTNLPSELTRVLDVIDFATPVTKLSSAREGGSAVIGISANGEYDYLAYQANNEYVVSVKPLTRQEIEAKKDKFAYVGERLSLSFQDIPVRNVLQLIADFTDFNLVASDTVSGRITLRLENVPWDQALDIVLKTKGLDKRQIGNVLMVAPAAEIAERERQEIETKKQLEELAPLRTEYIRIRYANARELFDLFQDQGESGSGGSGGGSGDRNSTGSILSNRGQAIVDERTNSIILTDTEEKISEFKQIIEQIDIPIRQVMIEARIVIADTDFRDELGVTIMGDSAKVNGDTMHVARGTLDDMEWAIDGVTGNPIPVVNGGTSDELGFVNLAVPDAAGTFAFSVIREDFLLGLELSALASSGYAEIVSQPKVITGDKQQATIMSGAEIAYQEESASGGTTTAFKEAVLKLDVTPQITPDNKIIMDLEITQDSLASISLTGIPTLDITRLETQVLVNDGATIVLGGIYQTESFDGETKVPLLGDIPYLGNLFKHQISTESKRELLIFITPRLMATELID